MLTNHACDVKEWQAGSQDLRCPTFREQFAYRDQTFHLRRLKVFLQSQQ